MDKAAAAGAMRARDIHRAWQDLPMAPLETILGTGRALILAPHPDDESLGCGGLIALSCRIGRPPIVVVVTDGTGSHPASPSTPPAALRALREREAAEALRRLGLADPAALIFLGLRDTAAPHHGSAFDAAVGRIADVASGCTTILAPWRHDPHCDHEAADRMARAVADRTGMRHLAYPVWGWTLPAAAELEWASVSGFRLNITDAADAKRAAIAAHRSQLGGVICDDSSGFTLPAELLHLFERPYEVFLTP